MTLKMGEKKIRCLRGGEGRGEGGGGGEGERGSRLITVLCSRQMMKSLLVSFGLYDSVGDF